MAKYKIQKDDIYSLAQFIGAQVHESGDEVFFKECPYCHGGDHHDENTLSVNSKSGAFKCFRSGCGRGGHFAEMARDFGFSLFKEQQIYRELPQPKATLKPSAAVYDYLSGQRKISKAIIDKYEIAPHKTQKDIIVFPFYNEAGKLVFIKYRNLKGGQVINGKKQPKEWCEKDCEPILFGIKQATDYSKPLIITEGQIDSLSLATAGLPNCCSVPIGCNGFTWVTNNYDWLKRFSECIVMGDNEHGKITLVDEIRNRFPKEIKIKAARSIDYLGEKDANDILQNFGTEALKTAIENAEEPQIPRLKDLADVKAVDLNKLNKIKSGIEELDKTIGGFCMGQIVILTGKRGEGKSTLASQFGANALNQGKRILLYSGELADFWVQNWLDTQLAGSRWLEEKSTDIGRTVYSLNSDVIQPIHDWYRGRCFIYDNTQVEEANAEKEIEILLETTEQAIVQKGVEFIIIDNLMTCMDGVSNTDSLYMQQSGFVGKLKRMAMKYQVCILLLTHPRKQAQAQKKNVGLDNDDIMGSGDITNKVDVVLAYGRSDNTPGIDSTLQILKNRLYGELRQGNQSIELKFSQKTKRIFSATDKPQTTYGWELKLDASKLASTSHAEATTEKDDKLDYLDSELPF